MIPLIWIAGTIYLIANKMWLFLVGWWILGLIVSNAMGYGRDGYR